MRGPYPHVTKFLSALVLKCGTCWLSKATRLRKNSSLDDSLSDRHQGGQHQITGEVKFIASPFRRVHLLCLEAWPCDIAGHLMARRKQNQHRRTFITTHTSTRRQQKRLKHRGKHARWVTCDGEGLGRFSEESELGEVVVRDAAC